MDDSAAVHGAVDCRALVGYDLRAPCYARRASRGLNSFIASGIWRDRCTSQIEFPGAQMAALANEAA